MSRIFYPSSEKCAFRSIVITRIGVVITRIGIVISRIGHRDHPR